MYGVVYSVRHALDPLKRGFKASLSLHLMCIVLPSFIYRRLSTVSSCSSYSRSLCSTVVHGSSSFSYHCFLRNVVFIAILARYNVVFIAILARYNVVFIAILARYCSRGNHTVSYCGIPLYYILLLNCIKVYCITIIRIPSSTPFIT